MTSISSRYVGQKKWAEPTMGIPPSPVRGEDRNLLVAGGLLHASAHAAAVIEAHDAFVLAEREDSAAHRDCPMQSQSSIFHAVPLAAVAAAEDFARAIDDRQQMMAARVKIERGDLCFGQVGHHRLPASALLLAE